MIDRDGGTHPVPEEPSKVLVLHVAVPDFNADDLDEVAGYYSEPDPATADDRLELVTSEWMRRTVGITLVGIPGDKCLNDEFEVYPRRGLIVGAEIVDRTHQNT